MELQYLTCPQLLSEDALCEILKDRCIELSNFGKMDKLKLLEIFTRVALPLSQRIYKQERPLGKNLQNLRSSRNIATTNYDESINFSTAIAELSGMEFSDNAISKGRNDQNDRLKPPVNDIKIVNKKIRLSAAGQSENHVDKSHDMKRKCQATPQSDTNKRQKITWP